MKHNYLLYWTCLLFTLSSCLAQAQVSPDNTLPQNSVIVNQGNILQINGGTEVNTNLFHSFEQFSIDEGQTAWFNNSLDIENIFSRVTGGAISNINGLLRTNGNTNLFLINPAGIIFGENASLDIGGSFFTTTADSIVFNDNLEFSATNPQAPPLLTINIPLGLQYSSNNTESIIESSGNLQTNGDLTFAANNLTLTGTLESGNNLFLEAKNNINISDSTNLAFKAIARNNLFITGENLINISALNNSDSGLFSGGNMRLSSPNAIEGNINYWSNGNFSINTLDGSNGSLTSSDNIQIHAGGDVNFADYIGSSLHIFAGGSVNIEAITINGSSEKNSLMETVTLSNGTIVEIDSPIEPTLDVRTGVVFNQGFLDTHQQSYDSNTSSNINIGEITITEPNGLVFLSNQYKPNLNSVGDIVINNLMGDGTQVIFDSKNNIALNSSGTINTTSDITNAGNINLIADKDINLEEGSNIFAITSNANNAGNIEIEAANLFVSDMAFISTSTLSSGNAGNITIKVQESIEVIGTNNQLSSIQSGTVDRGNAGNINIQTNRISLTDGGQILTKTFGEGKAGTINLVASEYIEINGANSSLLSGTESFGNGGGINIETGKLILNNRGEINTVSAGSGQAKDINIKASEFVELLNGSGIFSNSSAGNNAGDINIETGKLIIKNGSEISAGAFRRYIPLEIFSAKTGNISIVATDLVEISGSLNSQGSNLNISNQSTANGGELIIETDKLLVKDGGFISTINFGLGKGADLIINANNFIELIGIDGELQTGILTVSANQGDGGNLNINTSKLTIKDGASIITFTVDKGNEGRVEITVSEQIELIGTKIDEKQILLSSGIFGGTRNSGDGNNLIINTEKLFIKDGAIIGTDTEGEGLGGDLTVNATELVEIVGVAPDGSFSSRIDGKSINRSREGNNTSIAGTVKVNTTQLILRDGGQISITSDRNAKAGNLIVNAAESIELIGTGFVGAFLPSAILARVQGGQPGSITIETKELTISDGSVIASSTDGGAIEDIISDASNIKINATNFIKIFETSDLRGTSSGIFSDTTQNAQGKGGEIDINTDTLSIFDGGVISAITDTNFSGGIIDIKANNIELLNGGQILTTTRSQGKAGDIFIDVAEKITLSGSDANFTQRLEEFGAVIIDTSGSASGLFVNTQEDSLGKGGSIIVDSPAIDILNGATISADSQGTGKGGEIKLESNILTLNNGSITTQTASNQGGNIILNLDGSLQFINSGEISATAGIAQTGGDGGNITINSDFILAFPTENKHRITAEAFEGDGGDININTNSIFGRENINISASSDFGLDGTISINTPDVDPASGLVELPDVPIDVSALLARNICDIGRGKTGNNSSFINTGRGGLPTSPYEPLESNNIFVDVQLPTEWRKKRTTNSSISEPATKPIVEASAWVINEKGNVELVSQLASKTVRCGSKDVDAD